MNIRNLTKHAGELVNYVGNIEMKFDVIILAEIGGRTWLLC